MCLSVGVVLFSKPEILQMRYSPSIYHSFPSPYTGIFSDK